MLRLLSSDKMTVRQYRLTTTCDRTFSVTATCLPVFRRRLKTRLFSQSFNA